MSLLLLSDAWASSQYKTLDRFSGGVDGSTPYANAGLIFDASGNLYGTTSLGGTHMGGTAFELAPDGKGGWQESVLYSFCSVTNCADGTDVLGGVIFDTSGNLYGTTYGGGAANAGTVFKLTRQSAGNWTENVIYSFTGKSDGRHPFAGLVFDSSGNLYSTTGFGGNHAMGTVFRLTPHPDGSWTESVLHSFTGRSDGGGPLGGLILDGSGNLYGTTTTGGNSTNCGNVGCGVVFQLTANQDGTWKETVLHHFDGIVGRGDGIQPYAGLVFDTAGNLYGTTLQGGSSANLGTVFELIPKAGGKWAERVLYRFTGRKHGAEPFAGLIIDASGNLYGTTQVGGNLSACEPFGCGVVYKLAPNSHGGWHQTPLWLFGDHPGDCPLAGLVFDTLGNLYGTTSGDSCSGRAMNFGSVFEITP
jgi:uncharacterized repeat protein (TIGR03803 family)